MKKTNQSTQDELASVLMLEPIEHEIYDLLKPTIGFKEALYLVKNTTQTIGPCFRFTNTRTVEDHVSALLSWHQDARGHK